MSGADQPADHRPEHQGMTPRPCGARKRQASGLARAGAAAFILLAGGLAAAPAAIAVEWIVSGNLSQRFMAESNPDLEEDGKPLYGATTAIGIDVLALTPTTVWQFGTGASLSFFDGGADEGGLNGVYPNFGGSVSHDGKYIDTGASLGIDLQPAEFAQADAFGVDAGNATQMTIRLGANASMAVDQLNRLTLGVSGRIVRFTSGSTSLTPTTTYGTSLSWGHTLSADTNASLTFGARRFISQGDDDEESLSFDLSAGIGHIVNRRLSYNASLGASATRTTRTVLGLDEESLDLGMTGGFGLDWQPRADTQITVALNHGLEPTEQGTLQTTTALGAGLQHAINNWISGNVTLLLQRQGATVGSGGKTEEDRILATLSPSLSFSLTPETALRVGYSLRMEHEADSDIAFSNGVFLTLTRSFDIFP